MAGRGSPRAAAFTLLELLIVTLIISLIVAVATPGWMRSREVSRALSCQENLIKIEGAMDEYAMQEELNVGREIPGGWAALVGQKLYLRSKPACRGGGSYSSVLIVGTAPTCSYASPTWFDTQGDRYRHVVSEKQ